MHKKPRNKRQSAVGTVPIDAARADWATALRVAARSRRDFVARLAKDYGHSLRHAPRRAIDLASNAAQERYIEVPSWRSFSGGLALAEILFIAQFGMFSEIAFVSETDQHGQHRRSR